jgi:tRNA(Ile)-lysidine synthase
MLPEFSPLRLADELRALPDVDRLWVAYSGGLDSHVLLHALVSQFAPAALRLQAVHVDHGLASDAAAWARHCQRVCAALGVPLRRIRVNARPSKGESPEAAAREARYGALRSLLRGRECLLTAHHQDDQAETVLLQLLRGAGVRGLAAMPRLMPFGAGWLARPLLQWPREALCAYARRQHLDWVEDASNHDKGIDRNLLRQEVIPVLRRRWPAVCRVLVQHPLNSSQKSP